MGTNKFYIRQYEETKFPLTGNVFTWCEGRMFGRWVDSVNGNVRNNGHNENDLINNPAYIIESLLRDENFVERDLRITDIISSTVFEVSGLNSDEDDYYNNAIFYNITTDALTYITDYDGSTKQITVNDADILADNNNNVIVLNIQGDNKVDITSFDSVGNTTNGTRKDWIFGRVFTEKQNIRNILAELCFESHCELVESTNPDTGLNIYKLVAIDPGSGDTWTTPSYTNGIENIKTTLTNLENVFTEFRLRYNYDYGKRDYTKEIFVNKNGFPSGSTILSATEQNLCADAETNYKLSRLFEYSSRNIYDDATAERFLQKKIEWMTKQRLVVNYITPIIGSVDWIKYEIGDQVKINFSKAIPTGLNNSSYFMITGKTINPTRAGGSIEWELIEL